MSGLSIFERNKKFMAKLKQPYTAADDDRYQQLLQEFGLEKKSMMRVWEEFEPALKQAHRLGDAQLMEKRFQEPREYLEALNRATQRTKDNFLLIETTRTIGADNRLTAAMTISTTPKKTYKFIPFSNAPEC